VRVVLEGYLVDFEAKNPQMIVNDLFGGADRAKLDSKIKEIKDEVISMFPESEKIQKSKSSATKTRD